MKSVDKLGTVVHFVTNIGGGVWTVAKTLARHHRPRWRVLLVSMCRGPLRPAMAKEADSCFDATHVVRRPPITGIHYLKPVSVVGALETLGVDAWDDRVVYHFHTGPFTPCVYRLPRERRAGKWVACFHGSRGSFRDVRNPIKRLLHVLGVRRLQRAGFKLISVSHRSAEDCAALYRCREDDFQIVHNGTDPSDEPRCSREMEAGRPFRVGFVGTVVSCKGWQKVVAGVERLRRENLSVHCRIVGDGPDYPKLKQLAAQAEWLDAPGHVCAPDRHVYPRLDALVLPSDFEGHPEVVLEAMSCGVPCICSDVGGCAETVRHGQDGYILRNGSADEIADAIKRLILDDHLWTTFSRNSIERHGDLFTAQKMADTWERIYKGEDQTNRSHNHGSSRLDP